MKRLAKSLLYATVIVSMSVSCNNDEVVELDPNDTNTINIKAICDNEKIVEEYVDVEAKVVNPNFISDATKEQNLLNFFYLTIAEDEINHEFSFFFRRDDKLLIPVNLPQKFWEVGKKVIFSGYKKSCCGLHTNPPPAVYAPNFPPYGCKLELTKIREKK